MKKAFTLIELIAVLTLLSLLLLVIFPRLENFSPTHTLRSEGRYLTSLILQAREEAIFSGKPFGIRYDFTEQQVALLYPRDFEGKSHSQGIVFDYHRLAHPVRLKKVILPNQKQLQSGVQDLWIDPLKGEGSHIVLLSLPTGRTFWVKYNGLSGQILLSENAPLSFHVYRGDLP